MRREGPLLWLPDHDGPVLGAVWGARRLDAEDAACYWLWAFVARLHREEPVSEDQVALATSLMASGLGRRIKDKE